MTPAAAGGALTWPDYAILFVALAGLLLIGGAFTREQRDTSDFFLARLLGSGVRLMAACVAVAVLVGWPLPVTIALFSAISIVYIGLGGVKAVVWTNVFQASTFLLGGALTVVFLATQIDGGLWAMFQTAWQAGRL